MNTASSFEMSGTDYMRNHKLETQSAKIVLYEKLGAGNSWVERGVVLHVIPDKYIG